jgi:hypothetical protein
MLEELQCQVNEECEAAGLGLHFKVGPPEEMANAAEPQTQAQKWRICQDFQEVNKHTKVAPMPQGDICTKQHRLSGHWYVSVIDFTSRFYTIKIDTESRPYTAFYIEGLGHFWYIRMPFGLTGAPTVFTTITTAHLHDLIADKALELFVDDGGVAADTFTEMTSKLEQILDQAQEQKLSLSAAKSKLYMSEAVFAGARVGQRGVLLDLAKLTAVVDWKRPPTALNLASFVGLTEHFQDLIKGYAKIEGLLQDLLTTVALPQPCTKTTYR